MCERKNREKIAKNKREGVKMIESLSGTRIRGETVLESREIDHFWSIRIPLLSKFRRVKDIIQNK